MGCNTRIETEFFIIESDADGRGFSVRLQPTVKSSPHNNALIRYCRHLYENGIERINADQISLDFLDRSLELRRGNRKIDLVYIKNNKLIECELKAEYECGLDRTYRQVAEQVKHCEHLVLLVPRHCIEDVTRIIKLKKIHKVSVDTYE